MNDMSGVDFLRDYLRDGIASVEGWCVPAVWNVIEKLQELQAARGLDAPVCEIGVHHGKFFIGLLNTKLSRGVSLAIDLFEMQHLNADGSGKGDRAAFQRNLDRYGAPSARTDILAVDSLSIGVAELVALKQKYGGFSFFSVDGGHDAAHAAQDVSLAMELTAPGGVIFVDDYNNPDWPGVQEGVAKLFFGGAPRFVPFCLSCNKLMLTDIAHHRAYAAAVAEHIRANHPRSRLKKVTRYGWDCVNVHPALN
jgi:hypothetical protein